MSFYLGNDSNGNGVIAVSRSTESATALKNGTNFSNLVYHSKYQYTYVDIYTCAANCLTGGYFEAGSARYFKINVPPDMFKVNGIPRMFWLFINNSTVPVTCYTAANYTTATPAYHIDVKYPCYNYTDDTVFISIPTGSVATIVAEFFIFNFDNLGNLIVPTNNGSIVVNSNTFNVGGVDMFSTKWLISPAINAVDRVINVFGRDMQIVNSVPTTGSVQLSITSGRTIIARNNKVILDSSANYLPMIYNTALRLLEVSSPYMHYLGVPVVFRTGLPTYDGIALLLIHSSYAQYDPFSTVSIPFTFPILYNPAADTGLIPVNPIRGYPGTIGGICSGTFFLRINNGSVSFVSVITACTRGDVPDPSRLYNGPYQKTTTFVPLSS